MLSAFTNAPKSRMEEIDKLEQWRAIENNWPIYVWEVLSEDTDWPIGIDTQHNYESWKAKT
jgi:CMP-2-keto-3-deoxyoctulosonic acid synthetase